MKTSQQQSHESVMYRPTCTRTPIAAQHAVRIIILAVTSSLFCSVAWLRSRVCRPDLWSTSNDRTVLIGVHCRYHYTHNVAG